MNEAVKGTNESQTRRPKAEWSAIVFALTFPTVLTWGYFVALANHSAGLQQSAYSIGKAVQFGFPLAWAIVLEHWRPARRKWSATGLALGCGFGLAISIAMLALHFVWLKPSGWLDGPAEAIREKVAGVGISTVSQFLALSVFYSVCHSLLEEYYWRWFVFKRLQSLVPLMAAIAISSLGFMAHHVILLGTYFGYGSPLTWIFSASVAIGGAAWAWLYHRTDSLLGPWLSHCLVDAAIFLLGYDLLKLTW